MNFRDLTAVPAVPRHAVPWQKISSGAKPRKIDCVYILRNHIHLLSETYSRFSHEAIVDGEDPNACIHILMHYMDN